MAYDYEIVAWEGFPRPGQSRGGRYGVDHDRDGNPILPRPQRAHGVKVILTNPNNPGDTQQFWAFTLQRYDKWGQWYFHIAALVSEYGLTLEDDTIPPDPVGEEE